MHTWSTYIHACIHTHGHKHIHINTWKQASSERVAQWDIPRIATRGCALCNHFLHRCFQLGTTYQPTRSPGCVGLGWTIRMISMLYVCRYVWLCKCWFYHTDIRKPRIRNLFHFYNDIYLLMYVHVCMYVCKCFALQIRYIISSMCTLWSRRCFTGTTFTSVKVYYNVLKTFQYILYVHIYVCILLYTLMYVCMYVESR